MLWVRQCALSPYPLLDYLSSRSVHGASKFFPLGPEHRVKYQSELLIIASYVDDLILVCTSRTMRNSQRLSGYNQLEEECGK